jgi:hypothetical protein
MKHIVNTSLRSWRWRRYNSPKRHLTFNRLHSARRHNSSINNKGYKGINISSWFQLLLARGQLAHLTWDCVTNRVHTNTAVALFCDFGDEPFSCNFIESHLDIPCWNKLHCRWTNTRTRNIFLTVKIQTIYQNMTKLSSHHFCTTARASESHTKRFIFFQKKNLKCNLFFLCPFFSPVTRTSAVLVA